MRKLLLVSFVIVIIAMVSSCAHSPRSFKDSEAIKQIRLSYIKNNPDSKFNQHIVKGEIVKGMGFMGVLASWGLPNVRKISEGSVFEHWIYYTEDKDAGMWTSYDLVFEDQVLIGWRIDKNIAASGGIKSIEQKPPVSLGSEVNRNSPNIPLKKKP